MIHTRTPYPAVIPADMPRAAAVTVDNPRTSLTFAELARLEAAHWRKTHDEDIAPNNGRRTKPEIVAVWAATAAVLPQPFTTKELAEAMGIKQGAAWNHLDRLEKDGLVEKAERKSYSAQWRMTAKGAANAD